MRRIPHMIDLYEHFGVTRERYKFMTMSLVQHTRGCDAYRAHNTRANTTKQPTNK